MCDRAGHTDNAEDTAMQTRIDTRRAGDGARRLRAPLVAMAVVTAFVGAACATPSPPAGGGGIDINFGPLTIPLPPIEIRPPATVIPLGPCGASYQPPGVQIIGATVTIPGIRIDPTQPIITVPNVFVNIPQLRFPTSTVALGCPPLPPVTVQIDLIVPSQVLVQAATLNLAARTITLSNPTFTIRGAGLGVVGVLGGLDVVVPLPPIVSLPLPTTAISF
jgi:hypothetical protein